MNPVITFIFFLAKKKCFLPSFLLFTAFPCKGNNRIILTVLWYHRNRIFYNRFYIGFHKSHRSHNSIEYFSQNSVSRMRNFSVLPCKLCRQVRISRRYHTTDTGTHLCTNPLIKWISVSSAFRRENPAFYITDCKLFCRPTTWNQSNPGKSNIF